MNGTHGRKLFLAGVFLACMCGLMLQIMQTRILSVISYYHMAFFTIGMAMLGMTLGALLVYYDKIPFLRAGLAVTLAKVMTAFVCAVVISLVLMLSISLSSRFEPSLRFVTVWVLAIVVLSPPYVLLGMTISLALTRSPYAVSQVYGFDLLGAAIGCLVTLGLLTFIDTYTAVMLVGGVGAGSAWLFQQVGVAHGRLFVDHRTLWGGDGADVSDRHETRCASRYAAYTMVLGGEWRRWCTGLWSGCVAEHPKFY